MKITYTNPAPDEDMYPGEAVHWLDRGRRYFDYKDIWFQKLDRHHLFVNMIKPIDQSKDHEASEAIAHMLGATPERPELRKIGFTTQDLGIASRMLGRDIDFVFDQTTGVFFFDLRGRHEALMAHLYRLHSVKQAKSHDMEADLFVTSGLGIFKSTTSPYIHIGENSCCHAWLKTSNILLRRV